MNNTILKIITNAMAVLLSAWLLSGVHISGLGSAIFVAIILSLLNTFFKPLLIIFTIPITIFTFGLFLFCINAILIMIADGLIGGFRVDSFFSALLMSLIMAIVNSVIYKREEAY